MKQKVTRRQNLLDIMMVLFAKTISRLSENSVKSACCRKELTTMVFFVSIVLSSTSPLQFFFCILLSNNTLFLTLRNLFLKLLPCSRFSILRASKLLCFRDVFKYFNNWNTLHTTPIKMITFRAKR